MNCCEILTFLSSPKNQKYLLNFYDFNEFDIMKVISTGTFGFCYEARETKTQQKVALKVLKSSKHGFQSFLNETRSYLSQISHQNIVF